MCAIACNHRILTSRPVLIKECLLSMTHWCMCWLNFIQGFYRNRSITKHFTEQKRTQKQLLKKGKDAGKLNLVRGLWRVLRAMDWCVAESKWAGIIPEGTKLIEYVKEKLSLVRSYSVSMTDRERQSACVWIQYYSLPWAPLGSSTWLE